MRNTLRLLWPQCLAASAESRCGMRSNRRFLALVLIGCAIGAAAACSLITDVDRSKIEGTGGTNGQDDAGNIATGGTWIVDAGDETDAGTQADAAPSEPDES